MSDKVINLITENDWAELKEKILHESEIIIFKYSPICTVSFVMEKQFDKWFDQIQSDSKLIVAKVNVIKERPLSRQIADELKIRHQSPQAIWLQKDGRVKWHGSHHNIDVEELSDNLAR